MEIVKFLHFFIKDSSITGEVRRQASLMSTDCGFDETLAGKVSIVVNELCTNILKHATEGEVILIESSNKLEILAIDKGPGMSNVSQCLADGYSTQGTNGTGLGAIKRLSSGFDIYTLIDKGTVVYSMFSTNIDLSTFETGALLVNYPGEYVCGDGFSYLTLGEKRIKVLSCDGLGHGLQANEASRAAIKAFQEGSDRSAIMDINAIHNALRSTRGAAIGIADIELDKEKVSYAGLGNISATLVSRKTTKKLISYNGTAGVQLKKVQTMAYPLEQDWTLILNSDGLGSHWSLSDYPGLAIKSPVVIAAVLYRDHTRKSDDVSVVVIRKRI